MIARDVKIAMFRVKQRLQSVSRHMLYEIILQAPAPRRVRIEFWEAINTYSRKRRNPNSRSPASCRHGPKSDNLWLSRSPGNYVVDLLGILGCIFRVSGWNKVCPRRLCQTRGTRPSQSPSSKNAGVSLMRNAEGVDGDPCCTLN